MSSHFQNGVVETSVTAHDYTVYVEIISRPLQIIVVGGLDIVVKRSEVWAYRLFFADELGQPVEVGGVVVALLVFPSFGVDIDFQQFGWAIGEELHSLGSGGQQHTFACMDRLDGTHGFHCGDAPDTEVDHEAVQFGEVFPYGFGQRDEVGGEVGAFDKGCGVNVSYCSFCDVW